MVVTRCEIGSNPPRNRFESDFKPKDDKRCRLAGWKPSNRLKRRLIRKTEENNNE